MASFTLFDKPLFTGIEPSDTIPERRGPRASPVKGVQWQVLTAGGLRLSCTSLGALLSWPHSKTPLVGVSLSGQAWRRLDQFQGFVQSGQPAEQAFYDADWLED